jgi:uncharacterized protein (TIGR01777 family)
MRIAVTGSGGLIGSALTASLREDGHDVVRLVRRPPREAAEAQWNPDTGSIDVGALAGVEGAVHLAGAGVGDHRWTDSYKRQIRDSRVLGTRTLVRALGSLDPVPRVLVSGSAVGAYGDRGDETLTERSERGDTFLAGVVRDWEAEGQAAEAAGIRVAFPRTGIVLSRSGGALGRVMPLIKLGAAGPFGSGRQWWSWVTLPDVVAALRFLLTNDVSGPANLTAPEPARQTDVVKAIARELHRPALLPAPKFALRTVLGEFADDITSSQRALPEVLQAAGFEFRHRRLEDAAAWVTGTSD